MLNNTGQQPKMPENVQVHLYECITRNCHKRKQRDPREREEKEKKRQMMFTERKMGFCVC